MTTAKTEAQVRAACLAYLLKLARRRRERLEKQAQEHNNEAQEQPQ